METVYEGTWEEVAAHALELAGRQVRLIVEELPEEASRARSARLERGLTMAREFGKGLPLVPERHITLDFLYPDEVEQRG